jgi:hypothetical protein
MDELAALDEGDIREKLNCVLRNSAPNGWKYTVKVWALPGAGIDPIYWHMESSLKDPDHDVLIFNKTGNNMPKKDFYLVEFDLQDHSNLGLSFEPNPMNAFWVSMGNSNSAPRCPTEPSYSDPVYATCVDSDGGKLTIRNDDMEIQMFSFSLGFVAADGSHYRYDPGGNNQNGGSSA